MQTQTIVGRRYQVIAPLGSGNMGTVYRAADRLTGQTVALKRMNVPLDHLEYGSRTSDKETLQLTLAQEFKILATLRHPNIISVLDYGFDESRQPYVTMELLENGVSARDAEDGTLAKRVDLLLQILQALLYLHRRNILHRDLKPGNTLVIDGHLKVLDFGLSVTREQAKDGEIAGTPSYMAPELWIGTPATRASDLYAVGVMAFELFSGQKPFTATNLQALFREVRTATPDFSTLDAPPLIRETIQRMLLKNPEERLQDAGEAMASIRQAVGQTTPVETAATRESFLQAAAFVGRETEMQQMTDVLIDAVIGRGSAWLVAGESGVGKSRLLDEIRTQALVRGALVLRGQTVREGGLPYLVWRDALRWLALATPLEDRDASVLKALVPDIDKLLGRDVPDAPALSGQADKARLLMTIEKVFRAQKQPVVVILEDLHWAGDESLTLLARLAALAPQLPLLLIGSYRDDESPHLPVLLPGMQVLQLNRLTEAGTARLVEAMLGPGGNQPRLLKLLQQETEGNVFFLVEMVRALAEEAGQLAEIGSAPLPTQLLTGGVEGIIRRRLNRVPAYAQPLLHVAAIAGRQLDLPVIRAALTDAGLQPDLDVWLADCADAAVLAVQDGDWRFAHAKLRDGVLNDIPDTVKRELHRRVGLAMENVYQYTPKKQQPVAALAYHWHGASDVEKEEHYAGLAGEQALSNGAYGAALAALERALALQEAAEKPRRRKAMLMLQQGETYFQMGKLNDARRVFEACLEACREAKYTWGEATALSGLGNVASESAQYDAAAEYYVQALRIAMNTRAVAVALSVLAGMATLLARAGNRHVALEYAALALYHPASDGSTHYMADKVISQLRAELPRETVEKLLEQGKEMNLKDVAARILSE